MFSMNPLPKNKNSIFNAAAGSVAALGLGAMMLGAGNAENNTESLAKPVAVGQAAPDFTLTDINGEEHTLSEYTADGQTVVLEWFSPACPFVKKHYRDDTMTMINIQKDMKDEDIVWIRINSAKSSHPYGNLDNNKEAAEKWGITTPLLMDSTGEVGKAYGAKRTPEMYIVDAQGVLAYHGAIDNRSDAAAPGDINYVKNALQEIVAGETVSVTTSKAYGCSVKY